MKEITREIKVNTYVFAKFNEEMQPVEIDKLVTAKRYGPRILQKMGDARGKVCIKTETVEKTYSLPVDEFIAAAEAYARSAVEAETIV